MEQMPQNQNSPSKRESVIENIGYDIKVLEGVINSKEGKLYAGPDFLEKFKTNLSKLQKVQLTDEEWNKLSELSDNLESAGNENDIQALHYASLIIEVLENK